MAIRRQYIIKIGRKARGFYTAFSGQRSAFWKIPRYKTPDARQEKEDRRDETEDGGAED
jgi:hypothetical protein